MLTRIVPLPAQRVVSQTGKPLQSVHPSRRAQGVRVLCEYEGIPLQMTPTLIEEACNGYFVKASDGTIM